MFAHLKKFSDPKTIVNLYVWLFFQMRYCPSAHKLRVISVAFNDRMSGEKVLISSVITEIKKNNEF